MTRISLLHAKRVEAIKLLGALTDFALALELELEKKSVEGFDKRAHIEQGAKLLAELARVLDELSTTQYSSDVLLMEVAQEACRLTGDTPKGLAARLRETIGEMEAAKISEKTLDLAVILVRAALEVASRRVDAYSASLRMR